MHNQPFPAHKMADDLRLPEGSSEELREQGEPLLLKRRVYNNAQLNRNYLKTDDGENTRSTTQKIFENFGFPSSRKELCSCLINCVPIVNVLRTYSLRSMLLSDLLSGITLAVLHVPMGMGFGLLAGLSPVYGLYTSFFPVITYAIFGTSAHTSFGTNAVIAILTAGIIETQASAHKFNLTQSYVDSATDNLTRNFGTYEEPLDLVNDERLAFNVSIATAVSLVVGMYLCLMGMLRLGILTVFFSSSFISGFTLGASVHIFTSQLPKMLGLPLVPHTGAFKVIWSYVDIFENITSTNVASLIISLVCVVVLVLVKECVNERFKSKLPLPLPVDVLVVLVATIVSHFSEFSERFSVQIVNSIPSGVAAPVVPSLDCFPGIAAECFVLAVLIFTLSVSVAKLVAKKNHYEMDDNQELLAYGACNVVGGLFQCFPSCLAPPRTMLADTMKTKTTISGLFTAAVVLLVLLILGKFMAALPICALAALIVVALKGLYRNIFDVRKFWILNKWDFFIWTTSCLVTVIVDMDVGLFAGVAVSLLTVVLQIRNASGTLLGKASKDDLLLDVNSSRHVKEFPGIKIFRFQAPLFFSNSELFRKQLYKIALDPELVRLGKDVDHTEGRPDDETARDDFLHDEKSSLSASDVRTQVTYFSDKSTKLEENASVNFKKPEPSDNTIWHRNNEASSPLLGDKQVTTSSVILDFSSVTFIDATALQTLQEIVNAYASVGVRVIFAGCTNVVIDKLFRSEYFRTLHEDSFTNDVFSAINLLSVKPNSSEA